MKISWPFDSGWYDLSDDGRISGDRGARAAGVHQLPPWDKNGDPLFEVLNTVTFADEGGKTKFTLHASVGKVRAEGVPHLAGMEQGWSEAVDRLRDRLAQELGENYDSCIVDYSGAASC